MENIEEIVYIPITLFIGGKANKIATTVIVKIKSDSNILTSCCGRIDKVNNTIINENLCLDPTFIKEYISNIKYLIDMEGIENTSKDSIKTATRTFFQNIIDGKKIVNLKPGQLGYNNSLPASQNLDAIIKNVNKYLLKCGLIAADSPLSLQNPTNENLDYQRDLLPKGLESFIKSIDNNHDCIIAWEEKLRTINELILSEYMMGIVGEIRSLGLDDNNTYRSEYIINKLKGFIENLKKRTSTFNLQIMNDALTNASSPPPASLNANQHISQFSRNYSYIQNHESLISREPIPVYNPITRETQLLINKLNKLNEITDIAEFKKEFDLFKKDLSNAIKNRNHEETALFLINLRNNLSENLASLANNYIDNCISRLESPFPEDLAKTFQDLRAEYNKAEKNPRAKNKLIFLNELLENCRKYPEKSYHECINITKKASSSDIKNLVSERKLRFFNCSKHRFKDALIELKHRDNQDVINAMKYL